MLIIKKKKRNVVLWGRTSHINLEAVAALGETNEESMNVKTTSTTFDLPSLATLDDPTWDRPQKGSLSFIYIYMASLSLQLYNYFESVLLLKKLKVSRKIEYPDFQVCPYVF